MGLLMSTFGILALCLMVPEQVSLDEISPQKSTLFLQRTPFLRA